MTATSEVTVLPRWPGETLQVGPQPVHVRRAGPEGASSASGSAASGAHAVLVHGLGGSATNFTDLMGLLRHELDLTAVDLPGFGWSPPPVDGDYSLRSHARVVGQLIETVAGGRPVHLVGNSLGGAVVTLLAGTRPELVRTLTLVAPALPVLRPRASTVHLPALAAPWVGQRLARRLGRFPVEQRVRATMALCFADPSCVPPQRFDEAIVEAARRARLDHDSDAVLSSLRGLLSSYLVRGQNSLWRAAARVTAPTLLVYGQRDRLVDPRTAMRASRTFPNARLVVIPNSGHLAQIEHPDQVANAIRRLIRSAPPQDHQ